MDTFTVHYFGRNRDCEILGHIGKRTRRAVGRCYMSDGSSRLLVEGKGSFTERHWPTFRACNDDGRETFRRMVEREIEGSERSLHYAEQEHERLSKGVAETIERMKSATDEWTPTGHTWRREAVWDDEEECMVETDDGPLMVQFHRFDSRQCYYGCKAEKHYYVGHAPEGSDQPTGWSPRCPWDDKAKVEAWPEEKAKREAEIEKLKKILEAFDA